MAQSFIRGTHPAGKAPIKAPMASSEPIHMPSSSFMGLSSGVVVEFWSIGSAEELQERTVPTVNAPIPAVRRWMLSCNSDGVVRGVLGRGGVMVEYL